MQALFDCLDVSECVTVVLTLPDDFLDYDQLLNNIYRDIAGMIKLNHIFSVSGDDPLPVRSCGRATYLSIQY